MQNAIIMLFAHWVGDYALQTNEMAVHKSHSFKWLTVHVAAYCVPLFVAALIVLPLQQAIFYLGINAVLHWVTDLLTSRLASKYHSNTRLFHMIVGFDQFFHGTCLLGTLAVL